MAGNESTAPLPLKDRMRQAGQLARDILYSGEQLTAATRDRLMSEFDLATSQASTVINEALEELADRRKPN